MNKYTYYFDTEQRGWMRPHADDGDEFYSAADVDELVRHAIKLAELNYGEDDPHMWADIEKLGKLARAAVQSTGDT